MGLGAGRRRREQPSQILRMESLAKLSRPDGRAFRARNSRRLGARTRRAASIRGARDSTGREASKAIGPGALSRGAHRAGSPPGQHALAAAIAAGVAAEQQEQRGAPSDDPVAQVANSRRQAARIGRMARASYSRRAPGASNPREDA